MALGFGLAEAATARFTGREPRAPLEAVHMARYKMFVATDKAQRELGFQPGPVEDALRRAVDWFRKHHYC
jgi:dihydroflavonol-4-reductase